VGIVMYEIKSGMPATRLVGASWRKSRASGAVGACVEVAWLPTDLVAVRDSRDPHGPALVYPHTGLARFLAGAKKW
jgi:Domain of unknown function (DUF397)